MSDDKRKTLRDLLDELDRSFEEMEREIEEAVRHGFESGRKVFARPFVAGISMLAPGGLQNLAITMLHLHYIKNMLCIKIPFLMMRTRKNSRHWKLKDSKK